MLEVRRYVAVLARPDDCCGAGPCQERCPNGSLVLSVELAREPGPILSDELAPGVTSTEPVGDVAVPITVTC